MHPGNETALQRVWRISPERLYHGLRRRFIGDPHREAMRPRWVTVPSGFMAGVRLFIAPGALDIFEEMAEGRYDPGFSAALAAWPGLEGGVCWDIGAHVGYHSLLMAKRVGPRGRVFAFEPNPANQERFRMHMAANPELASRIRLDPVAIGEETGEATFVTSSSIEAGFSSGSHLASAETPLTTDAYRGFSTVTVPVRSIDHLLAEGLDRPCVLKVDVEGAELDVLKGASSLLGERRCLWLMEVHHILLMLRIARVFHDRGLELAHLEDAHGSASRCFISACHPISAPALPGVLGPGSIAG